jgi:TIR domain-containing protein/LysM domain-containing protein
VVALQVPDRFLVAFSYAGEQRDVVEPMADGVAQILGEGYVFFAPWWEHYLAGTDADLKLQQIYTTAVLTVVCVSGRYGEKVWTLAEWQAINARVMQARASAGEAQKLGVLPVRVGDGDPPGLFANTIAPDVRGRTAADRTALVLDRFRLIGGASAARIAAATAAGHRVHVVEHGDTLDRLSGHYLGSSTEWRSIAHANGLIDPLALAVGDVLIIPERETEDA